MKFTAAGDAIIQRRIQSDFAGYKELTPFISRGDARFFNLETTLNYEGDCFASQFSGGTWIRTNPEVLEDLKKFNFNMTSFNNNHAMDFSYDGLLQTLEYVKASGLVHGGVGRNLDEASAPRYLETNNGRVALISVNSNFNPSMMAGVQSRRVPGRPGVNGIRLDEYVTVNEEELAFIRKLAAKTKINASTEIVRKEGYRPELPADEAEFGSLRFKVSDTTQYHQHVNKTDMARVEKAIYEAKLQADYIMVSVHSHQIDSDRKEDPSRFLQEFAHFCIDAGANAVVGHGPHLLRPVEVYKDSPIFYSLGDFVLQLYNIEFAAEDFYASQGLTSADTIHDLLKKRSKGFTVGLMEDPRMMQTVIPYWETEGTKLTKLELMPVELVMQGNKSEIGLPRKAADTGFLKTFMEMSEDFGVKMTVGEDGIVKCSW